MSECHEREGYFCKWQEVIVPKLKAENATLKEALRLAQCPNPRDPKHGGHCETCAGLSVARTLKQAELEAAVVRLREAVETLRKLDLAGFPAARVRAVLDDIGKAET